MSPARRIPPHTRRPTGTTTLALAALCAVTLAASGCGGARPHKLSEASQQQATPAPTELPRRSSLPAHFSPPARVSPPAPSAAPASCETQPAALGSARVAYAATVASDSAVRPAPGGAGLVTHVGRLDLNGLPTVLEVTGVQMAETGGRCVAAWYRVSLSVLPNGTSGWIRARALRLYPIEARIVVNLARRRLVLYRAAKAVFSTPVGIGAPATPTPIGRFYVNERYILTSADGPFGPAALGISAHSVALAHDWVEQGPIALHGTDEPSSIGEAASHGCVHVPNAAMRHLFPLVPDGTPVVIQD